MRSILHALSSVALVSLLGAPVAGSDAGRADASRADAGRADALEIAGRVLGPDEKPLRGAEVTLEPVLDTYSRARLRLDGEPGAPPVARARTDAEGFFALDAPRVGMWVVGVAAEGAVAMEYRLEPLVHPVDLPVLRLARAKEITVRVKDAAGKPLVADVGVYALDHRGRGWRPRLRLGRAGEDGTLILPRGEDEKLRVEARASGRRETTEDTEDATVELTFENTDAGTVRVVDDRRRGIAGVLAYRGNGLLPYGLSDDDGRIDAVPGGDDPVHFRAADGRTASEKLDFAPRAAAGEAGDGKERIVTVRLEPPIVFEGRVIDARSRDPIAGALVWGDRGAFAVTDVQGGYRLALTGRTPSYLRAAAAGYQTTFSRRRAAAGEPLTLALEPAAAVGGRVVDADGRALPGAEIALETVTGGRMRMGPGPWSSRFSATRGGRFRIDGLAAGVAYRLRFEKPGFAPAVLEVEPLEPQERRGGLEAVLRAGRAGFGRVLDQDEAPIAGAEVVLAPEPSGDVFFRGPRQEEGEPALTDAEGVFEIPDLAAGRYDLRVRANGFAPVTVPGVEIAGDARTDLGTVVLVPGALVEGRVEDPAGRPIAGAEIRVQAGDFGVFFWSSERRKEVATSDRAGRFVVRDLAPGQKIALVVGKPGYSARTMNAVVPPTAEPLKIVLEPAARLAGRVLGPDREPVEEAGVMLQPEDFRMTSGRPAHAQTDADGRFVLEDVVPGVMTLVVQAESYQQHQIAGLELAAGESRDDLEIVLERGATVRGTVAGADGRPVIQASVTVTPQAERDDFVVYGGGGERTDADGRYAIEGVPLGPASIEARHGEHRRVARRIEVAPGTQVVDLTFEPGFTVSGQVVDPDGQPVAGAAMTLAAEGMARHFFFGGGSPEVSAADGTFVFTDVPPGRYQVAARREGSGSALSEPIEVAAGDVGGLLLRLEGGVTLTGGILGLELEELAAVRLIAFSQQGGPRGGQVDYEGSYRIEGLAPGEWMVQAQVGTSGRVAYARITIEAGTEPVHDIEFTPGFTLAGVVYEGGEPLPGVMLMASGETGVSSQTLAGPDGAFRLENLAAGTVSLMVMAGSAFLHMEQLELDGDREIRVDVVTARVGGRVLGADTGEPLAGASVALETAETDVLSQWQRMMPGGQTQTDSRGRFLLPRVREGRWTLRVTKEGYAPAERGFEISAGVFPEELEFLLQPTRGIVFEAVLATGATPPAVQASVVDPGGGILVSGGYPTLDGRVRISTVPEGEWELLVQAGDSAVLRHRFRAPGDLGRLVLPEGGSLEIRVPELESGLGLALVTLTDERGRVYSAPGGLGPGKSEWPLMGGHAVLGNLAPGLWTVTVRDQAGKTWRAAATVAAGEATVVTIP